MCAVMTMWPHSDARPSNTLMSDCIHVPTDDDMALPEQGVSPDAPARPAKLGENGTLAQPHQMR